MTERRGPAGAGVVAAGHPAVAEAASEILAKGGNAVDAVVAGMFVSFHAEPILSGPGGAGFMVARMDGQPMAWDFFSTAPGLGAHDGPYVPPEGAFVGVPCDFGSAVQTFYVGPGSVAVPSAAQGFVRTQSDAGRLSLEEVLQPGLRAASEGTIVTRMSFVVSTLLEGIVRSRPEYAALFTDDEGVLLQPGAVYRNPDLGNLYEELIRHGARALVDGAPAKALVDEVQRLGGGLTARDLAEYEVFRREPIVAPLGDSRLLLVPPPSSGGMLIGYGARLLGGFEVPAVGSMDEVLLVRAVLAETLRARRDTIGDETPTVDHAAALLEQGSIQRGRDNVRRLLEHGMGALPPVATPSLGSTTHISVIDGEGNAAASTVSIGEASGLVVPGFGIFPNNFLGEDDLNPLGCHRFPPGVRMGSSMSPTIVERPDGSLMALGTGGANRIRTVLLQVIRGVVRHGLTVPDAVRADRVHYENETLYAESTDGLVDTLARLEAAGTPLAKFDAPSMFFGGVHVAARSSDGAVLGVGDARRSGEVRVTR